MANVPEQIGIGPIKYDIVHKIREEMNKLSDEQIEKILGEVKQLVLESEEDVTTGNSRGKS